MSHPAYDLPRRQPDSRRVAAPLVVDEAEVQRWLLAGDAEAVLGVDGSFALARAGRRAHRPGAQPRPADALLPRQGDRRAGADRRRAHRRDRGELARRGWSAQFHPSYTRMVPAHHVTDAAARRLSRSEPGPPALLRSAARHAADGSRSSSAATTSRRSTPSCGDGSRAQDPTAPIGVPFSGGIDSGAVLLCLYKLLLNEGQSPARLKAFTLSIDGDGRGRATGARVPPPHRSRDARRDRSTSHRARSIRCAPCR